MASNTASAHPFPVGLHLLRAWYSVLSAVAPEVAEERFIDRFFTPRRLRRRDVPQAAPWGDERVREVRSGGNRLRVYEVGAGPVVLLAHGWEGSAADLVAIGAGLAEAGFRAVAFDMPAHGQSEGRQTTLVEMARALRDVAAEYGPAAGVVGHSLGSGAVVLALSQGLEAERAVLLAPPLEPAFFVRRVMEMLGFPARHMESLRRRAYARVGVEMSALNNAVLAREMRIPGLIFHGVDDREVPFVHGREITAAWPRARLVPLRGLGHRRLLRDPRVVRAVTAFIARGKAARCVEGEAA